jgi:hypothetical protein
MPSIRLSAALIATVAIAYLGCGSEPDNPYPQGYPQGYPGQAQQQPQGYPQQPMQPMQPAQPVQPAQPAQPVQPGQPGQQPNPFAGLAQAMGQMAGQMGGQPPGQAAPASAVIPWQSLSQALPTTAPGWQLQGQVEGETAAAMGISVSSASCKLKQGAMTAEIEILDNAMAAGMASMGVNMVIQVDTNEERIGRVNIGNQPGMQTFHKQQNKADVVLIVRNRLMVNVTVDNAGSEAPAVQLAQLINIAHLNSLMGG